MKRFAIIGLIMLVLIGCCGCAAQNNDICTETKLTEPEPKVLEEEIIMENLIVEEEYHDTENNLHYSKWIWVG